MRMSAKEKIALVCIVCGKFRPVSYDHYKMAIKRPCVRCKKNGGGKPQEVPPFTLALVKRMTLAGDTLQEMRDATGKSADWVRATQRRNGWSAPKKDLAAIARFYIADDTTGLKFLASMNGVGIDSLRAKIVELGGVIRPRGRRCWS